MERDVRIRGSIGSLDSVLPSGRHNRRLTGPRNTKAIHELLKILSLGEVEASIRSAGDFNPKEAKCGSIVDLHLLEGSSQHVLNQGVNEGLIVAGDDQVIYIDTYNQYLRSGPTSCRVQIEIARITDAFLAQAKLDEDGSNYVAGRTRGGALLGAVEVTDEAPDH